MKPELKPGDRVRLRRFSYHNIKIEGLKASIAEAVNPDTGLLLISVDGLTYVDAVYPSQCVKLKPKKPLRTWWVNVYWDHISKAYDSKEKADIGAAIQRLECVQVVEVREKRK